MAEQDWSEFFGNDQLRFSQWCSSFMKKLIGNVIHDFHRSQEFAEPIAQKTFEFCLGRRQYASLQHLEGALSETAWNFAHEKIRKERKYREMQLTLSQGTRQALTEGTEVPEEAPGPEEIVADHELESVRLAQFTAVKEYLSAKGHKDALTIIEVFEREGQELKRSEMITQTGLGDKRYDAARKQITRASVHTTVRLRARQLWLVSFAKKTRNEVVGRLSANRGDFRESALTESEFAEANQVIELASTAFDREFFSRKR